MSLNNDKNQNKYRSNGSTKESPWDNTNIFSKYALSFMLPIFLRSFTRPLTLDDFGAPPRVDHSRTLGLRLQNSYNHELLTKKEPSFLRAIFRTFGWQIFFVSLCDLTSKCIAYPMQTIALGWLIRDAGIYLNTANPTTNVVATQPNIDVLNNAATTVLNQTVTLPPTLPAQLIEAAVELTSDQLYWQIIYDAMYLVLFTWIAIVLSHPFFFQTYHIGMKARIAACYLIYKKSLRLSQSAMTQTTVGQMVNLLSNDVNRFDQVVNVCPYLFLAPIQAAVVVAILSIFYLGIYPTLASLVAILVYVAIQTAMGRGFSRFRSKTAQRTDERVRLMNEIILAIRIIKMYAWELPFKQLIKSARRREITTIGIASLLKVINVTLFFTSSKIIVFVALITYVLMGNSFNPEIVFVSIGLANLVRISLTLNFPNAIAYSAETVISCQRINKFLQLPEIESLPATYKASNDGYGCKYAITLNKVYASWAAKDQDLAATSDARWAIIRNLTLAIKPRDLVLIVGRVGSGKSSVLMSMLGELPIASGRAQINGRISYASQEAWIFSGTIRDNILFGKPFDSERYTEVIRVCSLIRDFDLLIDGDATIVGERGISLSGGQKARVNLARALYLEADIYLLDDPLSAVDAPVAKHIFNESLQTFLRRKTVVLATHQLQFLRYASKVLVVDRDSPAAFGTLQEVMESEAFAVVDYSKEAFEDATTTETGTDAEARVDSRRVQRQSRRTSGKQQAGGSSGAGSSDSPNKSNSPSASGGSQSPPKIRGASSQGQGSPDRLIRAESQASSNLNESVKIITPLSSSDKPEKSLNDVADDALAEQKALKKKKIAVGGQVGSSRRTGAEVLNAVSSDCGTYRYYIGNASGIIMLIWFVFSNAAAQGFYQYTDFFLSFWTDSVQRKEYQGANFVAQTYVDNLDTNEISIIYAILVSLCFFSTFLRTLTFFIGTLRASINIHNKFFMSIVHAPMSFFDFSPIGILLNRSSRDIGFIDETLPSTGNEIVTIFVNITGIIALTIIIDYTNAGAAAILFALGFTMYRICAKTITRLKQIEGVTRSPIFSHLSTTLSGLPTIRAFKVQDDFVRIFDRQQDTHTSAWFIYIAASRWLAVTLDWLCLVFIASIIALLLGFSLSASNASLVGLLISQVVVLPGPLQWGIRQLIEVESQMTSVQRIKEFSEIESEESLMAVNRSAASSANSQLSVQDYQDDTPRPESQGEIKFINLSLSYFPDEPPVLRSLNLVIHPREKIGIVGRTGAGKSSIVAALFRLYDFNGRIELNGRDTKSMTLAQLRKSMSIIPQDPILFGGSIRKNLDPFTEHSDTQLWDALEAVQLRNLFARYAQGLEFVVTEGGSNFSVGQRQLICLARAIVRRNQVLLLDEATANVDPETDVFIQRTIAQQFANCTVLTIAHRLVTIVDSDRVLVLDKGEVREFDSPYQLMQNEASIFADMINSSAQQAPRLKRLIEEAHTKRQQQQ